jgi:hypothetical protein
MMWNMEVWNVEHGKCIMEQTWKMHHGTWNMEIGMQMPNEIYAFSESSSFTYTCIACGINSEQKLHGSCSTNHIPEIHKKKNQKKMDFQEYGNTIEIFQEYGNRIESSRNTGTRLNLPGIWDTIGS